MKHAKITSRTYVFNRPYIVLKTLKSPCCRRYRPPYTNKKWKKFPYLKRIFSILMLSDQVKQADLIGLGYVTQQPQIRHQVDHGL